MVSERCHSCNQDISAYGADNNSIITCVTCHEMTHKKCATNNICKKCIFAENNENDDVDNVDIYKVHFNPLSCLFEDRHSDSFQLDTDCNDMSADMHYSLNTLESCKHVTIQDYDTLVKKHFDCKNMSVLFLNINGVKSNFDSFLAQVQLIELKFNFICFCETNLKTDEPNYYSLPGYNSEKLYAIDKNHSGSGITLYFKSSLNFKRIDKLCLRNSFFESLGGTFNSNFGTITLIVSYRFHCSENIKNFIKLIEDYISILKGPVIIAGDFNLNLLPTVKSPDADKYINCFMSQANKSLFTSYLKISFK